MMIIGHRLIAIGPEYGEKISNHPTSHPTNQQNKIFSRTDVSEWNTLPYDTNKFMRLENLSTNRA